MKGDKMENHNSAKDLEKIRRGYDSIRSELELEYIRFAAQVEGHLPEDFENARQNPTEYQKTELTIISKLEAELKTLEEKLNVAESGKTTGARNGHHRSAE